MVFHAEDLDLLRAQFPALRRTHNGRPIAFFDGPGGTQVPQQVLDAIADSYINKNANFDGAFSTSQDNTAATWQVRETVATFLGAESANCISFGANMTSLNYALSRAVGRGLEAGDEILITALDHEANCGPWLGLAREGIVVNEISMLADGTLDYADIENKISNKTKLIAFGLASNALGTVNDASRITAAAKNVGALTVADAVHYAAHFPVDVSALDIDFLLCSAYKFYGPHIGILSARSGLLDTFDTDRLSTQKQNAPYCIETGTLNYPALAGVGAAIEFIAELGEGNDLGARAQHAMGAIHQHEMRLAERYWHGLKSMNSVNVHGPSIEENRTPTVSFSCAATRPEDISARLADRALQVWHGHFYAQRVLDSLDLNSNGGLLRVGMSAYNTEQEVDRLLNALEDVTRRRA